MRTLVAIARLAKPGKLYIKRREPGIVCQFTHRFTLQTSDYDEIFDVCVNSASLATSFKKSNGIMPEKGTCREI